MVVYLHCVLQVEHGNDDSDLFYARHLPKRWHLEVAFIYHNQWNSWFESISDLGELCIKLEGIEFSFFWSSHSLLHLIVS